MKRRGMLARSVILTLALLTLLQGCGNGKSSEDTEDTRKAPQTETEENVETTPVEEKDYIVINGVPEYTIVYEAGSEGAHTAAKALYTRVQTKYKTAMTVISSDEVEYDPAAKEIYIGKTGFEESKSAEALLQTAVSFCVSKIGNKIVVIAGTDGLYAEKINDYIEKVIATNASFDPMTGKASIAFGEYTDNPEVSHTRIMVGDKDLKDYTIVYSAESTGYLRRKAEYLQTEIKKGYGVLLPIGLDTQTEESDLEILVGYTNRKESADFYDRHDPSGVEYVSGMEGDKYVITGGGYYAICLGIQQFVNLYIMCIPKEVQIPANRLLAKSYLDTPTPLSDGAQLRVMSLNIMAEYHAATAYGEHGFVPNAVRLEMLQAMLEMYTPDVIGMQEASPLWRELLAENLDGDVWGIVDPGKLEGSNGETIIIYNKTRLTLEDGGHISYPFYAQTSRICYGRFSFKDQPTKKFLFYTTHWSWSDETIADNEMEFYSSTVKRMREENGGIAAFCTGDFNDPRVCDRMTAFGNNSGLVDTYNVAVESKTLVKAVGEGNVDHIYAPPETEVYRYEMLDSYIMKDMTDHFAKYADVSW